MHFKILSATLAISCTVFLLLYYLTTRVQRYFRLKHIPGPLTASWSNIWLWKVTNYGNFAEKALDLDRKYGPVVRYGPNRVLFSQLEALPTIYGITNVMPKVCGLQNSSLTPTSLTQPGGQLQYSGSRHRRPSQPILRFHQRREARCRHSPPHQPCFQHYRHSRLRISHR